MVVKRLFPATVLVAILCSHLFGQSTDQAQIQRACFVVAKHLSASAQHLNLTGYSCRARHGKIPKMGNKPIYIVTLIAPDNKKLAFAVDEKSFVYVEARPEDLVGCTNYPIRC
jgi:hypothetical protein